MNAYKVLRYTPNTLVAKCRLALPSARFYSRSASKQSSALLGRGNDSLSALKAQMTARTQELAGILSSSSSSSHDDETDLRNQRRLALARAITLVESTAPAQRRQGDLLLTYLLQATAKQQTKDGLSRLQASFRVGIAGAPGVGKSSFIERFGLFVLDKFKDVHDNEQNQTEGTDVFEPNKLAVVCIDPSSCVSGGSILGDKTRMIELSRHERSFVRPCANGGMLGGLSFDTFNVVSLCQMAGYGLTIVESVGLGQSEIEIAQCVDLLILMVPPGGGDELQGVKKGIVEVADMIIVHKADGDLLPTARSTAADYGAAGKFVRPKSTLMAKSPKVLLVSSYTGDGMDQVWEEICNYRREFIATGEMQRLRQEQNHYWMWQTVKDLILSRTHDDPILQQKANEMEKALNGGMITPRVAASELLDSLAENTGGTDSTS